MKETLEALERKKQSLYREIKGIGDLRRGTISVNYRKCGKKNCACAKEGHPGHGPRYLWNATIKGKSYAKDIKLGPEIKKYLQETDNYRMFVRLCDEIVHVSEKISKLRPPARVNDSSAELEELKKNLQRRFMGKYKKKLIG